MAEGVNSHNATLLYWDVFIGVTTEMYQCSHQNLSSKKKFRFRHRFGFGTPTLHIFCDHSEIYLCGETVFYCCLQGQPCGLCLWFWPKRKMRMILWIKMTLQKWCCKNDVAKMTSQCRMETAVVLCTNPLISCVQHVIICMCYNIYASCHPCVSADSRQALSHSDTSDNNPPSKGLCNIN